MRATVDIRGDSILFDRHSMDEQLVGGDSGHPVFAIAQRPDGTNQAIVAGSHYTKSGFPCTCAYIDQINAICDDWGTTRPKVVDEVADLGFAPEPEPEPTPEPEPEPEQRDVFEVSVEGLKDAGYTHIKVSL